jgi:hypothetical protein
MSNLSLQTDYLQDSEGKNMNKLLVLVNLLVIYMFLFSCSCDIEENCRIDLPQFR